MRFSVVASPLVVLALQGACADLVGPEPSGQGAADATGTDGTDTTDVGSSATVPVASANSASTSSSNPGDCFAGLPENLNLGRIAVGEDHVCAIRPRGGDNAVLTCFGRNDERQTSPVPCGDGICPPTEVALDAVFGASPPRSVAAGDDYTCVTSLDGQIACFGQSTAGGLGANPKANGFARPVLEGVNYVSARHDTTCVSMGGALTSVSCFGENGRRQLDDSGTNAMTPVLVSPEGADVSVGNGFILFRTPGHFYARGQSDSSVVEQEGCDLTSSGTQELTSCLLGGARLLAAGERFGCMSTESESFCWGDLSFSAADCSMVGCTTPMCTCYGGLSALLRVASGPEHACFLRQESVMRRITCLGTGDASGNSNLVLPFEPIDVAASHDVTCALGTCGEIACWGNGADGQLGPTSAASSAVPVVVVP